MLGKNDQHLLDALDVRLSSIIMSPQQSSDRVALLAALKMINTTTPAKRPGLWAHFERTTGNGIRHLVSELHDAYETIAVELEKKPQGKGQQRLAEMKARLAAMPARLEGD